MHSVFLGTATTNAQLFQDTSTLDLVKKEIDYIYNLQFDDARRLYITISKRYPEHPIIFLLKGFITYWENYPLLHATPAGVSFEEDMNQCIKFSEKDNNPDYATEYLLTNLCSRGMLLLYFTENEQPMMVFPLTISTYRFLQRSFDIAPSCVDLYYFTGIYNYYREAYPRIYPVYKPLALLFPEGDEEKGLNDLKRAATNSVVMKAESYFMLSWLYLKFENNYSQTVYYSKTLHEKYPRNRLYHSEYIKNLLLMKQYDEAEKIISTLKGAAVNEYFDAQLLIYNGILQEKKYLNNDLAKNYFNRGITDISYFGDYGKEYAAYAFFGLSRIAEAKGSKNIARRYRNEAIKLADFKKINFD